MSDSVYDRLMAANKQKEQEYAASLERARHNPYSILRVSPRKSRIIKQEGHAAIGWGVRDILQWSFASGPLSDEEIGPELKRLRGEA